MYLVDIKLEQEAPFMMDHVWYSGAIAYSSDEFSLITNTSLRWLQEQGPRFSWQIENIFDNPVLDFTNTLLKLEIQLGKNGVNGKNLVKFYKKYVSEDELKELVQQLGLIPTSISLHTWFLINFNELYRNSAK